MNHISIDFTSFTQIIQNNLQKMLGKNYTVFSHTVKKNNGVELTGIVAKRTGCSASPTIYINRFFKENLTEEEVQKVTVALYDEFQAAEFEEEIDLSDFVEFEKAKEKLAFKLIHAEKNRELLKSVPYKRFYNLAIVFYYTVQEAPFFGQAIIMVHNSHMEKWKTNENELFKIAFENTPLLFPSEINSMEEVMREIISESLTADIKRAKYQKKENESLLDEKWLDDLVSQMNENTGKSKIPMYVLTNKKKLYGAACMLYPGVLKKFADKEDQDLYILPSSIHEVILIPASEASNQESLLDIVTDINRTQVPEDEVLADAVYYYIKSRDKVVLLS
ncbi:MAG: DUF5688 family protein [Suilimivivens sp.]